MPLPAHRFPALLRQTSTRVIPPAVRLRCVSPRLWRRTKEYEDSRDSVAEALIRWVPPITAILCAAIALCGFVYYQFVL